MVGVESLSLGSKGAPPLVIPGSARKVVQELKEIVKNGEEEIYAMLKDCNMDPNETVQRLLAQDTFHEVRRKRDKKKENGNKETGDTRSRSSGFVPSARGGRVVSRGIGRGNFAPHLNKFGGRAPMTRENGSYQNSRALGNSEATLHADAYAQPKLMSSGTREILSGTFSGIVESSNGSNHHLGSVQEPPRSSLWVGRATMADIVKGRAAPQSSASSTHMHYHVPAISDPLSADSAASFLNESTNTHDELGLIKRDIGENKIWAGNEAQSFSEEGSANVLVSEQSKAFNQTAVGSLELQLNVAPEEAETSETSIAPVREEDHSNQLESSNEARAYGGSPACLSSEIIESLGARGTFVGSEFEGRELNESQHQKGTTIVIRQSSVEAAAASEDTRLSPSTTTSPLHGSPLLAEEATLKLHQLHLRDDQRVIIPQHLQVPEAQRANLSFGSFCEHFNSVASPDFVSDDNNNNGKHSSSDEEASLSEEDDCTVEEEINQPVDPSVTSTALVLDQSFNHQPPPASLTSSPEITISLPASSLPQQETSKSVPSIEENPVYPYLPTVTSYQGLGLMPQVAGGQHSYETAKIQSSDASRLPNFVQSYSDPASFLGPAFRASLDVDDPRNPQILSINASSKFSSGISLMTGQSLSTPQAGGSSVVPAGQSIEGGGGLPQTTISLPQQPLPLQAYPAQPAGFPYSPFGTNFIGYQYAPPNFTFLHNPYSPGYTGNTAYPQMPTGSSNYAQAKYSPSQYKVSSVGANAPYATGYGNYSASSSSAGVTAGTASGYEDGVGSQLKENLYIPNQQQVEGSALWLSRDMVGMQGNSYYNMAPQGQHSAYSHSHPPPTHAHPTATAPVYASLYHPSQNPPLSAHHLLQQQSPTTQLGAYQQTLRTQLNWANGY